MASKKTSPVKAAGKVTKKASAPKKATTKKASASAGERKFVKAVSTSKSEKDAQDFATYTIRLYLKSSDEPIAEIGGAMPNAADVHWCSGTGPEFHVELSCMGKDGQEFVCDY